MSLLDHSWKTILPDLIIMGDKLEALSPRYFDEKVIIEDSENEEHT